MSSVLQNWVMELPFMQQSVLLSAIRGPDTSSGESIAPLVQWLRRCVLISSLDQEVLVNPHDKRGGKFTGPSYSLALLYDQRYHDHYMAMIGKNEIPMSQPEFIVKHSKEIQDEWPKVMMELWDARRRQLDYHTHHYVGHFRDAAQVLGYKHADPIIRSYWAYVYATFCGDTNMTPETVEEMDQRLDDFRQKKKEAKKESKEDAKTE